MNMHIIALYPAHIAEFEGREGVRICKRSDRTWTQMECEITKESGSPVAKPKLSPPAGVPPPMFRIQLECRHEEGQHNACAIWRGRQSCSRFSPGRSVALLRSRREKPTSRSGRLARNAATTEPNFLGRHDSLGVGAATGR